MDGWMDALSRATRDALGQSNNTCERVRQECFCVSIRLSAVGSRQSAQSKGLGEQRAKSKERACCSELVNKATTKRLKLAPAPAPDPTHWLQFTALAAPLSYRSLARSLSLPTMFVRFKGAIGNIA